MNDIGNSPCLRMHPNYERLMSLASDSHARGRAVSGISESDIGLARLYSHAFRGQVIGAFPATRRALESLQPVDRLATAHWLRAKESLVDLANRSMDIIGHDVRALLATFHHYGTHIARTIDALDLVGTLEPNLGCQCIRNLFVAHMEAITAGNGLHLTRDTGAPEQGCFVVPNLGITIVPLVYGDHHSWNLAWLDGAHSDVPYHLHRQGVEIHLGYSPLHGCTILGDGRAELTEGYAMPIPAGTRHGYTNIGSQTHHVPFIFGSLSLGGWGVFLDVEPEPRELDQFETVAVPGPKMNGTIHLEREIAKVIAAHGNLRYPIITADKTDRGVTGGLELAITRVTPQGMELCLERFCAVSVVRGRGLLKMANEQIEIAAHDHFGIPAGLTATIVGIGSEPLVLLDTVLRSARSRI